MEQVAEYKELIDTISFAGKIKLVCEMYNDALAIPEVKHPGMSTLSALKEIYFNIYRWQVVDRFRHYQSEKLGWETNIGTKPLLCQYAAACLTADILRIHSDELIDELEKTNDEIHL